MNIQKFTQKSVEAINDCEKLAYEYGNQEIEQEHLLVALLRQEDGLIPKLIEKMEIQKEHFVDNAERHLAARVKVSGGQVYVGHVQKVRQKVTEGDEISLLEEPHLDEALAFTPEEDVEFDVVYEDIFLID